MKKIFATSLIASTLLFGANSDYNYEITPMIGNTETESNLDIEDQLSFGASIARNLEDSILNQVELGVLHAPSVGYYNSTAESDITKIFVNGVKDYKLTEKFGLYALAGLGYENFSNEQRDNESDGFVNYGIGLKYQLTERLALKTDARHLINFDGDNTLLYTLGLAIGFDKKTSNQVEKPVDSDNDGIIDSLDACPNSKPGAKVNSQGCEVKMDSDNDGILDVNDKCPNSPAGARVNSLGCEIDTDNDGVVDSKDSCPNSLAGAKVNALGCEMDSDKDGVVDSQDKCPNTVSGFDVDYKGCIKPIDLNLNFETNSDIIKSGYEANIAKFANFLKNVKSVNARIEAHTDSDGSAAYNYNLAKKRADATVKALINLGVDSSRLSAKSFGETKPLVPNTTSANKAKNRRVEAILTK